MFCTQYHVINWEQVKMFNDIQNIIKKYCEHMGLNTVIKLKQLTLFWTWIKENILNTTWWAIYNYSWDIFESVPKLMLKWNIINCL